eukprot:5336416-Alexandrium_andersonii.AAC.1
MLAGVGVRGRACMCEYVCVCAGARFRAGWGGGCRDACACRAARRHATSPTSPSAHRAATRVRL